MLTKHSQFALSIFYINKKDLSGSNKILKNFNKINNSYCLCLSKINFFLTI